MLKQNKAMMGTIADVEKFQKDVNDYSTNEKEQKNLTVLDKILNCICGV